jgi:hypothetical protein
MRNFISIFMILAFVITTTMVPAMAHAMPHDGAKAVKAESTEAAEHDCHGHGEAKADSQKTVHNDKDSTGKCCDKGMCKCVGGNCHSLSKYFGNSGTSLSAASSSSSVFGFKNQLVDSALPERLKRPPKA